MRTFIDYITEEQARLQQKGYEQMNTVVKDGFGRFINELCYEFQEILRRQREPGGPMIFSIEVTELVGGGPEAQVFFVYQFSSDSESLTMPWVGFQVEKKLVVLEIATADDLPDFKNLMNELSRRFSLYQAIIQITKRKRPEWVKQK